MVQITNALLLAAIITPSIAAPLEVREPKFNAAAAIRAGRKVFRVAGKIGSGVGLAASIASLIPMGHKDQQDAQQRRDLDDSADSFEAREPQWLTPSEVSGLAHEALNLGKYAKEGIELGAAMAPMFPHIHKHSRRSFDDSELAELERRFHLPSASVIRGIGSAIAGAAGLAGTVAIINTRPEERDLSEVDSEDIYARDYRGDVYYLD